jgi:CHASE3 domain sensor protein
MSWYSKTIAAGALLILACIGALSYSSEVRSEKDREWVRHTYMVVENLQEVRIDITQAETGQRDFMLTGQGRHMEMYSAGVTHVREDLNELSALIADNPAEREAIGRLDALIAARLAELGDGIEVRKHSGLLAGAKAVTNASSGEKRMAQIATQIAEMRHTEDKLLSSRLDAAEASTRKMNRHCLWQRVGLPDSAGEGLCDSLGNREAQSGGRESEAVE